MVSVRVRVRVRFHRVTEPRAGSLTVLYRAGVQTSTVRDSVYDRFVCSECGVDTNLYVKNLNDPISERRYLPSRDPSWMSVVGRLPMREETNECSYVSDRVMI